ncbi:MAG: DUF5058 family protein [Oscillospiraceae bacterium]|nr:DUF5058 family protein [Oscillospiraceae bacterium]
MSIISQLNRPAIFLICGIIIFFVAIVCVFFMVRAYRAGKAIGMDTTKMKRAVTSSATFAILPSIGILLGVIALSGSLGTPLPWLRLSVIGALHYETQVAEAAAEAVGLPGLSGTFMTAEAFTTIALLMSVCIMWGMVFSVFANKRYLKRLSSPKKGGGNGGAMGFGDTAMTAMFIGLVSAYIGSYIGSLVSGNGLFTFTGSWLPIAVVIVAGIVMAVFIWLAEKKNAAWVENFSIAGSMIVAMAAAVALGKFI